MRPQFDTETQIEHLQGYLYVQQVIKNCIYMSEGGEYNYSIYEYFPEIEDVKSFAIDVFLQRLKGNTTIDENSYDWMQKNTSIIEIKGGKSSFKDEIKEYFFDNLLNVSNLKNKFIESNLFRYEGKDAQNKFIADSNSGYASLQNKFDDSPSLKAFLGLILDNSQFYKFKLPTT